jgi:hypothetical protein
LSKLGYLTCEVWTVGEEYIVAYHLDCNAGSYRMSRKPGTLWNRAILGYGPSGDISDAVHGGLRGMVEQLTAHFLRSRGKLGRNSTREVRSRKPSPMREMASLLTLSVVGQT